MCVIITLLYVYVISKFCKKLQGYGEFKATSWRGSRSDKNEESKMQKSNKEQKNNITRVQTKEAKKGL